MTVSAFILTLLPAFVQCFTRPGLDHFTHFILAHAALCGPPHCLSETLRATRWHERVHWTTPYAFLRRARFSCAALGRALLGLLTGRLGLCGELVLVLDDTLTRKWGRRFFGLGYYPDPTDKNPGARAHRVLAHCWVVLGLLCERAGVWHCLPLSALLFVPQKACSRAWPFLTKIELGARLLSRLALGGRQALLVVDNLYAKAALAGLEGVTLVSRLRGNARLYEPPPKRKTGQRGRPRKRGRKVTPAMLWRRRRQTLTARLYGQSVTLEAWVGVLLPSPALGDAPIRVVVVKAARSGQLRLFFSTDAALDPVRLLELYAARFKIEECFRELKSQGGLGDCRQRGAVALKRHAALTLTAHSLLKLAALELPGAARVQAEPWWRPQGAPAVGRLRRAVAGDLAFSRGSAQGAKVLEIWPARPPDQARPERPATQAA